MTPAERAKVAALVEAAYVEALEVHGARSFNAGFVAELWAHTNAKRDLDALLSASPESVCKTCKHERRIDATGDKVRKAEMRAKRRGCCVCGKLPIFYLVGPKGYCGACKDAAYARARATAKAWS